MTSVVAYGHWPSPITAAAVVAAAAGLSDVRLGGDAVFWSESRPEEGGRIQLVRRRPDGTTTDLLPEATSARTRVHEYGGGAWCVAADGRAVFFCSWADQRIWRLDLDDAGPVGAPTPITPAPPTDHAFRYADLVVHGDHVVCVRERHDLIGAGADEAVNEIVALPTDGSADPTVLVTGADFVAAPRISPDGRQLAWICWDHPSMPWDSTELRVANVHLDDDPPVLGPAQLVAGGAGESVIQPSWCDDGRLHFLSDRTGWWNLYVRDEGSVRAVTDLAGEIGTPPWVFGMARYGFLADGRVVAAVTNDGVDRLVVGFGPDLVDVDLPYTDIASVVTGGDRAVFVGAGFDREPAIVSLALPAGGEPAATVLRAPRDLGLDPAWFSTARSVSFPSGPAEIRTAHALYYPPTNPEVTGPDDAAPPLLVMIHGGPTAMARPRLDLAKQFWTSRGFAVVDVNYGGSTGYGRDYRDLLQGSWGIVDVEDCIAAANHLADEGLADPARLCIRGGSAGGFTVLAAMSVTGDGAGTFAAGASSYGVADLTALATDTHKFESRYLDGLVGPYPEAAAVYDERSPINHVDRLNAPLIVFQGLEDEVVPPNQSEMIVEALRAKGVPVEYHAFEGEQHGFRKAETVIAVLEAELAFYRRVLG